MPKVELHVHLEGAMMPDTVWMLAERNGVHLPVGSAEEWRAHCKFRDFNHFIELYNLAASTVRTPEDFALIVERFCAEQARQNIRHSEAILSVSMHIHQLPGEAMADALAEGVRRGQAAHGVSLYLLPDISRHLPGTARAVLDFALMAHKRHPGVFVGLQLGGKEEGFPAELFADVYAAARREGLRVLAHAGETAGPESVRAAVEILHVERIGHGIRCLEDSALVDVLRDRQIPLEVCPTSNVCLKVVSSLTAHPLPKMLDAGLNVTINSDDPPMFNTTLTDEWLACAVTYGWDLAMVEKLSLNAVRATFLPATEKSASEMRFKSEWKRILQEQLEA